MQQSTKHAVDDGKRTRLILLIIFGEVSAKYVILFSRNSKSNRLALGLAVGPETDFR